MKPTTLPAHTGTAVPSGTSTPEDEICIQLEDKLIKPGIALGVSELPWLEMSRRFLEIFYNITLNRFVPILVERTRTGPITGSEVLRRAGFDKSISASHFVAFMNYPEAVTYLRRDGLSNLFCINEQGLSPQVVCVSGHGRRLHASVWNRNICEMREANLFTRVVE